MFPASGVQMRRNNLCCAPVRHRDADRLGMLCAEPGVLPPGELPGCGRNPLVQFSALQFSVQVIPDLPVAERLPCGRRVMKSGAKDLFRFVNPAGGKHCAASPEHSFFPHVF